MSKVPGPWSDPESYDREFFRRSFAACVITDQAGRVLLVHTTHGERKWDLPGGVLERGEAPWEAVRREAREEIRADGVEVSEAAFHPPSELPSPMSSFARERIADALAARGGPGHSTPVLKVRHREDREVR